MNWSVLAPFRAPTAATLPAILLIACTGVPDGVAVVGGFKLEKYLGTWYEIARLDHRFERGLDDVTATYSRREDGGVRVLNRGFNPVSESWKEAEGRAYFNGPENEGRLKVSFFGPFYGGYNIIALDPYYQYAMVAGPDRSYLWILARTPQLDAAVQSQLIEQARGYGFAVDDLIFVRHETP